MLAARWSERRCHARWGRLVRPDGYGRWREHDTEVDFFLEYDQGTEPLDRVAAKLAGYHKLAVATKIATPVVFWLPTSGWEASVRAALAAAARWETGVRFVVATATAALGRGAADQAWLPLGQDGPRRRLVDLAAVGRNLGAGPPSPPRS